MFAESYKENLMHTYKNWKLTFNATLMAYAFDF